MIYPPFVTYQAWKETQLRPTESICPLSAADCHKRGQSCYLRHVKLISQQEYHHKCQFRRLIYLVDEFYDKYPYPHTYYNDYFNPLNVQVRQKYLSDKITIDFYQHLIRDHKSRWFDLACNQFASQQCIYLGYVKNRANYSFFRTIKLMKKKAYLKNNPAFMEQKLTFGRYSGKTWSFVERHHPQYVNWVFQNFLSDQIIRLIAQTIISHRKPTHQKLKQIQEMKKNLSFMNDLLEKGKYADKTWAQVQKIDPKYVEWAAQNLGNCYLGDFAKAVKMNRKKHD